MGDGIQAAKAGILEIGDVYVVNKADRDGADTLRRDLRSMLALAEHRLGHVNAVKEAVAKARAGSKPGTVWDKAEVDLLAAELDTALPSAGK